MTEKMSELMKFRISYAMLKMVDAFAADLHASTGLDVSRADALRALLTRGLAASGLEVPKVLGESKGGG